MTSLSELRETLANIEVDLLMTLYRAHRHARTWSAAEALDAAMLDRTMTLAECDPCLVYLPLMCCIVAQARADHRLACVRAISTVIERVQTRSASSSDSDDGPAHQSFSLVSSQEAISKRSHILHRP